MNLTLTHHVEVTDRERRREEQRDVDQQHLVPAHVVADHHGWKHQHREHAHQRVVEVRGQMKEGFGLDAKRQVGAQNARQQLAAGLNRALRPAVLLRLERVHLHRHFRRRDEIRHEHELPAPELRAITEVEVLGERVVLPAARIIDRRAAPDACRPVEVEETAAAMAAAVLEDEMPVEKDRLDLREQRVVLVDVAPPRLHHADPGIPEMRHQADEEVLRRNEVRVENPDELTARASSAPPRAHRPCTRFGRCGGST